MASPIRDRLNAEIKNAMKAGEKTRLATLRFMMAAIKQVEIDTRTEPDDTTVIAILTKLTNQRRESIAQFSAAGRDELAAKEREELVIVEEFLPTPLTAEEVEALLVDAITRLGASSIKDMGKVMNDIRPQLIGRTDLSAVSARVKQRLGG